jgi:Carboxypeptidase regulatory-like domain
VTLALVPGRGWLIAVVLAMALVAPASAAAAGEVAQPNTIEGVVTKAGAGGVEGAEICAIDSAEDEEVTQCAESQSGGSYQIAGIPEGAYVVRFERGESGENVASQYYDNATTLATAKVFDLGEDQLVTGIDAELKPAGKIVGSVTDATSGAPIAGATVCAFGAGEECAATRTDGGYEIMGVGEGSYELRFRSRGYEAQLGSVPVSVDADESTPPPIADAALTPEGSVSGHVYSVPFRLPVAHSLVCLFAVPGGEVGSCEYTDGKGAYWIGAAPGQYRVGFSLEVQQLFPGRKPRSDGWPTQYWNLKPALAEADVITLQRSAVSGIDATLGYVAPAQALSPPPPPRFLGPPPPPPPPPRPCRRGSHRSFRGGFPHCVRTRHRHHRHHRHHHRRHRGAPAAAGP